MRGGLYHVKVEIGEVIGVEMWSTGTPYSPIPHLIASQRQRGGTRLCLEKSVKMEGWNLEGKMRKGGE